ncbi:hypothetical protein SAMN05518855_1008134 [Paenibacillus sp. CF384]|nr:hypothetical protein SAMN05518855_1008134 [Paenibacillus sp. CF384]
MQGKNNTPNPKITTLFNFPGFGNMKVKVWFKRND